MMTNDVKVKLDLQKLEDHIKKKNKNVICPICKKHRDV